MRWLERRRTSPVAEPMAAAHEAAGRGGYAAALALGSPLAGVPRAQNNIGACVAEGLGVRRDPALAVRWLSRAAAAGGPQCNLAAVYFKGEAGAPDSARAAAAGDPPAQEILGVMLREGEAWCRIIRKRANGRLPSQAMRRR